MSIFSLRRRDAALSELKVPEAEFTDLGDETLDTRSTYNSGPEPDGSPANELATSVVELDIAEAVRADISPPPPAEQMHVPAPLSQRHLETIDRMVAHLKADERRLEEQIGDARRQLADTQLARHGYERNSADLRRGIDLLVRQAQPKPALRRQRPRKVAAPPTPLRPPESLRPEPANDSDGLAESDMNKPRGLGKMH